jgi:beta-xylosidase
MENGGMPKNPFITHMYTADPSAHVWADGRLYVYPSTDIDPPRGCDLMDKYHVFSTDDMVHWKDHGQILEAKDVEWGRPEGGFMWAPDCAFRDGTYYFYFPHPSASHWNDSWKIGVATSREPAGGFKSRGYIPGLGGYGMIDPAVFTDDDGQAWMVYGGAGKCHVGKMKENMVEIEGEMKNITGELQDYHEGPWLFKRQGTYYLMYPDNYVEAVKKPDGTEQRRGANRMHYAIAASPLGPWKHQGILLDPTGCDTSHGSIVEFKGQWYLFYHNQALSDHGCLRSICVDKLFFNADGTIQKVEQTK